MMHYTTTNAAQAGTSRLRARIAGWLVLFTLILASAVTSFGQNPKPRISPDLANFPRNSDGTIDVIIQFVKKGKTDLDGLDDRGGIRRHAFKLISGAAYRVPERALEWLEKNPHVRYVSPDRPTQAYDDEIPAVMADLARQQYALDGSGVGIAVIDSGVYNHDDLQNSSQTGSRIVYSQSFVSGDATTNDAYGHGTHVAGIAAGNGYDSQSGYAQQYIGLAPNANIINLRVLDANGAGTDSQVIAALQRAVQLKSTYNIRVINLSLGRPVFESYTLDPLCQAVEAAWQSGIVVVVAAGNNGRGNSMGTLGYATINVPGNDPLAITVGATKTNGTTTRLDDYVASYSSKGPTLLDHVVKPDLVAPGNRIISLESPGSTLAVNYPQYNVTPVPTCILGVCTTAPGGQYLQLSGTSMATPVVAGAAALMFQQNPNLTPDTVKARMMKTAWKGYPTTSWAMSSLGIQFFAQYDVFTIGAGYLDVDAVLGSSDVANGSAASPIAVFNTSTGQVTLVNPVTGTSIVWGNSIVWGQSVVWGSNVILSDSIIWGNSIVWGQSTVTGNSIIWGTSIVWGAQGIDALSAGENGEN